MHSRVGDEGAIARDHTEEIATVVVREVDVRGEFQELRTVAFAVRGGVRKTRAVAVQPAMAIGIVGYAGEIIEAHSTDWYVKVGTECFKELVRGPRGAAVQA